MLIPLDAAQAYYSTDNIPKAVSNNIMNLNRFAITCGFANVLCVTVFVMLKPLLTQCAIEAESKTFP